MRLQASLLSGGATASAGGGATTSGAGVGTAGWRALVASSGSGAGDSGSGSVIGTNKNTMAGRAGRAGRAGWPGGAEGAGRARLLSRRTCLLPHEIRMHDEPARRVPDELERVARH